MVGQLLQYQPVFNEARRITAAGERGALRYVYSNRLSLGKFRVEENVMWSFAPHDLSMILALVDEAPSTVTAQGASYVTPGLADWCICHMRFPSGIAGHVTSSWLPPFKETRLVVIAAHAFIFLWATNPEG